MADDHVELQAKARVIGDVSYRSLEMHVWRCRQGSLIMPNPGPLPWSNSNASAGIDIATCFELYPTRKGLLKVGQTLDNPPYRRRQENT
jgi:hypothetical protein